MTDILLQIGASNLCISLVLAIVAWAVHTWCARPGVAHLLWVLVLVKLVTPPILTLPVIPVPETFAAAAETLPVAGLEATVPALQGGAMFDPGVAAIGSTTATTSWLELARTGLILLWLLGTACVLVWSLVRIYRFNRLLGMVCAPAPPELQRAAAQIARRLNLKTTPMVCLASAHVSPMVWWIGGPVRIIIPEALPREMDAGQLRWILAHELAHVRRRDHLVRWLEWLACVCFWWNPVAWWARRNLRINEEICCDALVLASFEPPPRNYANALMTVVEFLASPAIRPPAVASEMNSGGLLERRFRMIVSTARATKTPRWLVAGLLLVALGLMPLGVASADVADKKTDKREVDTKHEDLLLAYFGSLVANDAMDGRLAFDLYAASQESLKNELVAAGKTTPEAFDRKLGMAMRFAIAKAKMTQAVADGEMKEEDVKQRLSEMHKKMSGRRNKSADWGGIEKRIEAAVARGDLTREEADAKYAQLRKERAKGRDAGARDDGMWRRVAGALKESGIRKIEPVMGAMHKIAAEQKAEGKAFELAPRMLAYLQELGLTKEQITLVVGLSRRVAGAGTDARRKRGKDRADDGMMWRRLAAALAEAGVEDGQVRQVLGAIPRIVEEMKSEGKAFELDPKMQAYLEELGLTGEQIKLVVGLAQRVAHMEAGAGADARRGRGDAPSDMDRIRRRIESAVKSGDMTREEADAMYRGIRERMGRRERTDRAPERTSRDR